MPPKKKAAPKKKSRKEKKVEIEKMTLITHARRDKQTIHLILIGVLLALFAGSVILLQTTSKKPESVVVKDEPIVAEEEIVEEDKNILKPGGSIELVSRLNNEETQIIDQGIVWKSDEEDIILIESVNELLPGLSAEKKALYIFARPTETDRVFFATGPSLTINGTDAPPPLQIVAFDPKLRSFVPLVNFPDQQVILTFLSPNKHRIAFPTKEDEYQEYHKIWVYDMMRDQLYKPVSLPDEESLTETKGPFGPTINISWNDLDSITYHVYEADQSGPESEGVKRSILEIRSANIVEQLEPMP